MKYLLTMRHGKAEHSPGVNDFERQLVEKGQLQAKEAALALKAQSMVPDWILTSTARRAQETAEIVQNEFAGKAILIPESSLYLCSVEDLIDACHIVPAEINRVMIVGHNPSIEYLTDRVTRDDCRVKTSEVRCFSFMGENWVDLALSLLEYEGVLYTH